MMMMMMMIIMIIRRIRIKSGKALETRLIFTKIKKNLDPPTPNPTRKTRVGFWQTNIFLNLA